MAEQWSCPDCPWGQRAHPVYGWAQHDDRAVEVHRTTLCPARTAVRGEVEAGRHPHASTCAWTVADDPCDCGVDDRLAARLTGLERLAEQVARLSQHWTVTRGRLRRVDAHHPRALPIDGHAYRRRTRARAHRRNR